MIQHNDRIGFITRESAKGLDLFLLPTAEHPKAELKTYVDPSEVTLAALPNAMNELTGMDRAKIAADELSKALSGGHVVRMREGETKEEALARGRLEIAVIKKAHGEFVPPHPVDDDEPETDEVGRTPDEMENIFGD